MINTTLGQRIKTVLDNKGITAYKAGNATGIGRSLLGKYMSDINEPSVSNIKLLSEYLDVSLDWLVLGKGNMERDQIAFPNSSGIPLYRSEAAAGFGTSEFNIDDKDIEARYQIREMASASFMLHVRGDSMVPTYKSGDIIAVKNVVDRRDIQWGKPHLISTNTHGLLVKRIYDEEGDIIAVSDNPTYKPIHIHKMDITGIAMVIGSVRLENY